MSTASPRHTLRMAWLLSLVALTSAILAFPRAFPFAALDGDPATPAERHEASRAANDRGVRLEELGRATEADAAYAEAVRLDSGNTSAALNQFGLYLEGDCAGDIAAAANRAWRQGRAWRAGASLAACTRRCGTLRARTLPAAALRAFTAPAGADAASRNGARLFAEWLALCAPARTNGACDAMVAQSCAF